MKKIFIFLGVLLLPSLVFAAGFQLGMPNISDTIGYSDYDQSVLHASETYKFAVSTNTIEDIEGNDLLQRTTDMYKFMVSTNTIQDIVGNDELFYATDTYKFASSTNTINDIVGNDLLARTTGSNIDNGDKYIQGVSTFSVNGETRFNTMILSSTGAFNLGSCIWKMFNNKVLFGNAGTFTYIIGDGDVGVENNFTAEAKAIFGIIAAGDTTHRVCVQSLSDDANDTGGIIIRPNNLTQYLDVSWNYIGASYALGINSGSGQNITITPSGILDIIGNTAITGTQTTSGNLTAQTALFTVTATSACANGLPVKTNNSFLYGVLAAPPIDSVAVGSMYIDSDDAYSLKIATSAANCIEGELGWIKVGVQ